MLGAHRRGSICRVLLADAAEVDLHPGLGQAHRPFVPLDTTPAYQRRRCRDCG
jgi:hypothetical protein